MGPQNTPPHEPVDEAEYLPEGEQFEIVDVPSGGEESNSDEESMEDEFPTPDDAKIVLRKHKESVFCVDVHPNGQLIATGSQDNSAIIWDLTREQDIFTCEGHGDSVACVAFSPGDGEYLATGDMAGEVHIWRLDTSATPATVVLHQSVSTTELTWLRWWQPPSTANRPSNRLPLVLLTGSGYGTVTATLVNANSGGANARPPKFLVGSGTAAVGAAIVPSTYTSDRPYVAAVFRDGDFRVWDLKTEACLLQASLPIPPEPPHLQRQRGEDPDGDDDEVLEEDDEELKGFLSLAAPRVSSGDGAIDIVAVAGNEVITLVPCRPPPLEEIDAMGGGPKKIAQSSLATISLPDAGTVEVMEFSPTHPFLAFGTVNGLIGVYDVSSMRMRQTWTYSDPMNTGTDEGFGITALKWSQATPLVFFTSTLAATVVAWNAANPGVPLATWHGHSEAVLDIALAPPMGTPPKEKYIISVSDDATVRVFEVNL